MSHYNMYFSPTGGTKKVADILTKNICDGYETIDLCKHAVSMQLQKEDICLISVPSYGGRVPAVALERLQHISANGAKVILVCVYGNRAWEDTLTELQDTLEQQGFLCVAAVAAVAEHSIFRQFGSGRPDAEDTAQLTDFAKQLCQKLAAPQSTSLTLDGSHGTYKVYNGVPFHPQAGDTCTECGLCAKECPADAIDAAHPQNVDTEKCISCMRCVSVCPQQARHCDAALLQMMGEKMAPLLGGRKENHLFV